MQDELRWFEETAASPSACLRQWQAQGGQAVGCLPYYVPEELIWSAGLLPVRLWGAATTARRAGGWFPPYVCSLVQTDLELALGGVYQGLRAVVGAPVCDSLRCLSQNWRAAVPELPLLTYSQPQNRATDYGKAFLAGEYRRLWGQLCALTGCAPEEARLREAMDLYNRSRAQRRRFTALAGRRGRWVRASQRCAVLKAAGFADPRDYTDRLTALNDRLEALPEGDGGRIPVVTSGILCDHPRILALLDELGFFVTADDVAAESRSFAADAPEGEGGGCAALAGQFAQLDRDPLLWSGGTPGGFRPGDREVHLASLARRSGAKAVVILVQQFCDPEELLSPGAKAAVEAAGIPCLLLPVDQQVADPGQAATLLETLRDLLE